jgi:hypothetical protein
MDFRLIDSDDGAEELVGVYPLEDLLGANEALSPEEIATLRALPVGGRLTLGGGAAPLIILERATLQGSTMNLTDRQRSTLIDMRNHPEGIRPDILNGSAIKALCRKGLAQRGQSGSGFVIYTITEEGADALKPENEEPETMTISFED